MQVLDNKNGVDVTFVMLQQRHIETFAIAIKESEDWPAPAFRGAVLRAAIKCGWIENPSYAVDDVATMSPKFVRVVADAIATMYSEAMDISPKS